jgi:serine protease
LAITATLVLLAPSANHTLGREPGPPTDLSGKDGSAIPGQLIVHFREGTPSAVHSRIAAAARGSLVRSLGTERHAVVSVPAGEEERYRQVLLADAAVEFVEPNLVRRASFTPNDEFYARQWNLQMIQAEPAWDITFGDGVTVAVVDTGVAYEDFDVYARAPDLAEATFVAPWDFVNDDSHANDDQGHGTHVAGTAAQSTNNDIGVAGVSPGAAIMPVKVLDSDGFGSSQSVADGVFWAVDSGADIINLSLGGGGVSLLESQAYQYAEDNGVVVIAAAGNGGFDGFGDPFLDYPAAIPTVISVGAVDSEQDLTYYSNFGFGDDGSSIDIVAPGGDTSADLDNDGFPDGVVQNTFAHASCGSFDPLDFTNFGYCSWQGTSMATPHVSGVAALVLSIYPDLTPSQVRQVLTCSAKDIGPVGNDLIYGAGLVQAFNAIRDVDNDGTVDCLDSVGPPAFNDVGEQHWAYPYVAALSNASVTQGCSAQPPLYCPGDSVTRAEMATFLVRALGLDPVDPPAGTLFEDVPASGGLAGFIERLAELGITTGCSIDPPLFCPDDPVTRAQMAAFILRAIGHADPEHLPAYRGLFPDVPSGIWYALLVEHLMDHGITAGYADGTYRPKSFVSRAQMAAFITRAWALPMPEIDQVAPANDDFATAVAVSSLPFSDGRNTLGAALEEAEPQPCALTAASVWYSYTPDADTTVTADTSGSDFDTVVAVYTGPSLGNLLEIACNDDSGGLLQSTATFLAAAGQTYYVQVGGFGGYSGDLALALDVGQAPENDSFEGAVTIPGTPFADSTDTAGATFQPGEPLPCAAIGATVWYSYTPAAEAFLTADTFGSDFDTVLAVYTGDSVFDLTQIACNDDSVGLRSVVSFPAAAGETYHFQVGGWNGDSGNLDFALDIGVEPPPPPPPGAIATRNTSWYVDGFGDIRVVGEVYNDLDRPIGLVEVAADLYSDSDVLLAWEFGYACLFTIPAESDSPYEVLISDPPPGVDHVEVEITFFLDPPFEPPVEGLDAAITNVFGDTFDLRHVQGTITNNSPDAYDFVNACVASYDDSGTVLRTGWAFADPDTLGPGASANFEVILDADGADIASDRVWVDAVPLE